MFVPIAASKIVAVILALSVLEGLSPYAHHSYSSPKSMAHEDP